MKCFGRSKTFVAAMLIVVMLIMFNFTGCSEKEKNAVSSEEAVAAYLDMERGESIELEKLDDMVLKIFSDEDVLYYVMRDDAKEDETVYVLGVTKKEDGYVCTKESADFSLEPDNSDPLIEHNAIIYQIPVKNFYINVGKIYQDRHEAYFKGERLAINENGMFAVKSDDSEDEVEIEYIEKQ